MQRISPALGKWIGYQMKLRGVTQADVAARAGRKRVTVGNVLSGLISSGAVYNALAETLGYEGFDELLAAAPKEAVGDDLGGRAA